MERGLSVASSHQCVSALCGDDALSRQAGRGCDVAADGVGRGVRSALGRAPDSGDRAQPHRSASAQCALGAVQRSARVGAAGRRVLPGAPRRSREPAARAVPEIQTGVTGHGLHDGGFSA